MNVLTKMFLVRDMSVNTKTKHALSVAYFSFQKSFPIFQRDVRCSDTIPLQVAYRNYNLVILILQQLENESLQLKNRKM